MIYAFRVVCCQGLASVRALSKPAALRLAEGQQERRQEHQAEKYPERSLAGPIEFLLSVHIVSFGIESGGASPLRVGYCPMRRA